MRAVAVAVVAVVAAAVAVVVVVLLLLLLLLLLLWLLLLPVFLWLLQLWWLWWLFGLLATGVNAGAAVAIAVAVLGTKMHFQRMRLVRAVGQWAWLLVAGCDCRCWDFSLSPVRSRFSSAAVQQGGGSGAEGAPRGLFLVYELMEMGDLHGVLRLAEPDAPGAPGLFEWERVKVRSTLGATGV